jgi:hypothetical protein
VRALHAPSTSRQRRPASATTTPALAGIVASSPTACERGGPGPATVIVTPSPVVGERDGPGLAAKVAGSSLAAGERDGPGPV